MSMSRKEKNEQKVAERVEQLMADTKYQWLRTRRGRVGIASAMIAMILIIPAAHILLGSFVGLLAVFVAIVVWLLLRVSVRLVADLPEEYLDERQTNLRNRAYVESYRWLALVVVLLATVALFAFIILGDDNETWRVALSWEALIGIFWMLEACALSIPSIVIALRDRELPRVPADA